MNVIVLKGYFLNKCIYWLIALAVISMTLIFVTFDISREDRFIFSVCVIGAETYFVFFLNRFEPKSIKIQDKKFEVSYLNYKFFKKEDQIYTKNDVKVVNMGDILLLSNKDGIIGKIRKKALSAEDWTVIKTYFV